jgi:hypothetical protein
MHGEVPDTRPETGRQWFEWIVSVPGLILSQLAYISIYHLPSVTIGAVFAYAMMLYRRPMAEFQVAMLVGMSTWLLVVFWLFRPARVVERYSKQWDRWYDQKLITGAQRRAMRQELNDWYRAETMKSLPRSGKPPSLISASIPESSQAQLSPEREISPKPRG